MSEEEASRVTPIAARPPGGFLSERGTCRDELLQPVARVVSVCLLSPAH